MRRTVEAGAGAATDLLAKLGRTDAAQAEFRRAAEMTGNQRDRDHLLARAADLDRGEAPRGQHPHDAYLAGSS